MASCFLLFLSPIFFFFFCKNYGEVVTGEGCGHADPPLMTAHSVVLFRSSAGNLAISHCTVSAEIRYTKGPRSNCRKCSIVHDCTNSVPIRPYKSVCPSFLALAATIAYESQLRFGYIAAGLSQRSHSWLQISSRSMKTIFCCISDSTVQMRFVCTI
jgi:hypothetical protein